MLFFVCVAIIIAVIARVDYSVSTNFHQASVNTHYIVHARPESIAGVFFHIDVNDPVATITSFYPDIRRVELIVYRFVKADLLSNGNQYFYFNLLTTELTVFIYRISICEIEYTISGKNLISYFFRPAQSFVFSFAKTVALKVDVIDGVAACANIKFNCR